MPTKQSKIKFFLLLMPIITLLSGCEFKDIDKNVFVSMIGIDLSEESDKPYKVTIKLYVPTSSFKQSPEPRYAYLTETGETLSETIRLMESYSDKELEFGHTKLIVLGEELIKENKTKEIVDFFVRRPDFQMISWVAVGKPSAQEVVKMVSQGENAAYPALFNYFDDIGTESQFIVTTYLFDFRRRLEEKGIDPLLPIIEVKKEKKHFEINKSLLLVDKKEPHELTSLYTQTYNILSRTASLADVSVKTEGEEFFVRVNNIKSKYKVNVLEGNKIELEVEVSMRGYISESKGPIKPEEFPYYNQLFKKEGEKIFTDFLTHLTDLQVDPLGFGIDYKSRTLHNNRMSNEEWKEAYKNAKVKVTITPGIKSTGAIQ